MASATGNTGFNNLDVGYHSDSDADSNLEFSFLINNNSIPSSWIFLDNQSTVDVFHNPQLLRNIREVDTSMEIHCNAGTATTNLVGDLPGHGVVWFHPHGIANILSLSKGFANNHVIFDSKRGNKFIVKDGFGRVSIFKQSLCGLYYLDANRASSIALFVNFVDSVDTVSNNVTKYSNCDYSNALLARKIQRIIGCPSTKTFLHLINNNLLPKFQVTSHDS